MCWELKNTRFLKNEKFNFITSRQWFTLLICQVPYSGISYHLFLHSVDSSVFYICSKKNLPCIALVFTSINITTIQDLQASLHREEVIPTRTVTVWLADGLKGGSRIPHRGILLISSMGVPSHFLSGERWGGMYLGVFLSVLWCLISHCSFLRSRQSQIIHCCIALRYTSTKLTQNITV